MKRIETLFAVASVAVFAAVTWRMNWAAIIRQVETAAIAIPILIVLSLVRLGLTTKSWSFALREEQIAARLLDLAGIRLAAQAMGYLTVFGVAVSEPMKITLLRKDVRSAATGTLVDSGIYWFSSASFGAAACLYIAVALARMGHTASLVGIAAVFAFSIWFLSQRTSVLGHTARVLGARGPSWLRKGAQLENAIRAFRSAHPKTARSMFAVDLACQLILFAETTTIIFFMGLPLKLPLLLGVEVVTRMVKLTSGWVPARIGADEGGAAAAFAAFGLSPGAGVVLALTRRFRDLLWCALGLGWFGWRSHRRPEFTSIGDTNAGSHCFTR
jgi:hypothetical protein